MQASLSFFGIDGMDKNMKKRTVTSTERVDRLLKGRRLAYYDDKFPSLYDAPSDT